MTTETNEMKTQRPGAEAMNTALEDLKALVRDAEDVLANAGDAAGEQVTDLQERMRKALDASRSRLNDMRDSAREHLDEYDEYVRSHPYQSIGMAVAVGALLGVLLGRRSS
jgi:ElaB/YqjD/DUF883 family membrane-anchored ribosome-binding protein